MTTLRLLQRRPRVSEIQKLVAAHFLVPLNELLGPSREQRLVVPRMVSMWLCAKYTTGSVSGIARRHHRDHTCVLNAVRRIGATLTEARSPLLRHIAKLEGELARADFVMFPPVLRAPRVVLAEARRRLEAAAAVG
jgi:chromosomal replication initiation ATPase DnaA